MYLSLTLISSISWAQTGKITGNIHTSDGQPAEYVSVGLKGLRSGTISDEKGNFTLNKVKPGQYVVVISYMGSTGQEQEVIVEGEKTSEVNFTLNENAKELEAVTILDRNRYNDKDLSTSLRLLSPIIETPQNIQIVTMKVLKDQQVISMSDGVIRNVSGATRIEHWGDLYANITMRGSQIQAFRNGFNVVSSYWGPLTEDMSFVDHIEFVKGPAGFMLANGDPSGLYNVVTKKPTGQTRGEVNLTMGSYDLYRTSLDLDGKLNKSGKLLYRLNLAAQNKKSFRANEYNNRYVIAPVISYQINDQTKITAEYNMQYAKMSDVGSYYIFSHEGYATLPRDFTTLPAGLEPTKIKDQSVLINFEHNISKDWKLTAQASYLNYQQKGANLWPKALKENKMIRQVGIWDAKSEMSLAQVFLNGNAKTGSINHRILAGVDLGNKEYFADWAQYHNLDTLNGGEFNLKNPYFGKPKNGYPKWDRTTSLEERAVAGGGIMTQKYSSLYLQDELGFLDNKIRLTLAGRYTYVSQSSWGAPAISDKHFSPRLGLSVSVNKQTSVYALYDQAFLPQGGKLSSGGTVKPITGNNQEIGIKRDWAGGRFNSTLSLYRIIKKNELTGDPNSAPNSGLSIVVGEKTSQGLEFDVRGSLLPGLDIIANYAYTDSKVTKVANGVTDIKVNDAVPGFAKHNVNSWITYKIQNGALKGAGISGGFTYLVDRATQTWNSSNASQNLPNYFKLDGGVFWEKDKLKLTLNIFNVLDKYLYSGAYYSYFGSAYSWQAEAPRNSRLSINYRF